MKSLLLILIAAPPAFGYVDPGSGSYLLQCLLALGFGIIFQFRKILSFFRKK